MLVFDLETDGLLDDVTKIHCLVIYDSEADTTCIYNDQGNQEPIVRGVQRLEDADVLVGHNILGYDLPVLQKIYLWFDPQAFVLDTLLLSRLYHTDMMEIDQRRNLDNMPSQLYGRHSLESYGHRLGEYKGEFGKSTDWQEWSPEMEAYCAQDVKLTTKLCDHFHPFLSGSS
jgi:hypothetical protein